MKGAQRAGLWALVGAGLALTASAYLDPQVVVDLANKVWSCF